MGFVFRVLWILLKSLVSYFVWNHQYFEKFAENPISWDAPQIYHLGICTLLLPVVVIHCWTSVCVLKWSYRALMSFSDVGSENATLFKRLMKIHSNPSILQSTFTCTCTLYYGNDNFYNYLPEININGQGGLQFIHVVTCNIGNNNFIFRPTADSTMKFVHIQSIVHVHVCVHCTQHNSHNFHIWTILD